MNAQIKFLNATQVKAVGISADWDDLKKINTAIQGSQDVLNLIGFFRDDDNYGYWIVFRSEKGREVYCVKLN